ncbi:MAG: tRNA (adenosine(37)-N6)-dimethylallyltransferase MiaA [Myxococcota bacterium]|nr:tRNA (adenosine(37)-N6)-dimethylallyltransferase MiaA [Myxococcota bacterium]
MKLLVLGGPTGTGKTQAAIHVACLWDAVIISADAMQVYRGMDIGTGKAPASVLNRYPHVCVSVREPHERFDATDFSAMADQAIQRASDDGRPVVVAGGTGFYLRVLLQGLVETPEADPTLRSELEAMPDPHAELARVDPVLAARLHPNDRVRIIRGLEVFRLSNRRLSDLHAEHAADERYEAVSLWLDREDLDARIDARVMRMMERGYLEEVRGLLDAGVGRGEKPMCSLGYRHLAESLEEGLDLDEAVRRTQRDTRKFARKQRTFLRSLGFPRVEASDRAQVLEAAEAAFGKKRR